jgi:sulfite exporter TauE/SafE
MPRSSGGLTSAAVLPEAKRGVLFAVIGIVILALNVIDAADRGASAGNVVAIAAGAFLLFWGFAVVARSGRPPSS